MELDIVKGLVALCTVSTTFVCKRIHNKRTREEGGPLAIKIKTREMATERKERLLLELPDCPDVPLVGISK
jgi:hypothetical protein